MPKLLIILISSILVNNFVMSRFLGICPFLGVSKKTDTALGMGLAVIFVITVSSAFTYLVYQFLLVPLHVEYLYNIAFILVIASLVQMLEMVLQKVSPTLYSALGVYLPLITTNCAVLGVAVLNMQEGYNLLESVVNGFAAAVGFTLGITLFAGVRERIEHNRILSAFEGFPIAMIAAGLMAIAFFGFKGLI
ncbi:MAG: electron transport complex subunit RsxA [Firmicutes bacterium]|nr:electron transport complex subunit RsxA [Bacillota bacterium]